MDSEQKPGPATERSPRQITRAPVLKGDPLTERAGSAGRGAPAPKELQPQICGHTFFAPPTALLEGGLDLGADVEDLSEPRNRRPSPSALILLVPLAVSLYGTPFLMLFTAAGILIASPGALRDPLKGAEPRSYTISREKELRIALA